MALYVKDLSDIVQMVVDELKLDSNDTREMTRIKRDINAVYMDEVVPFKRWLWLSGNTSIEHKPYYANGTATVTPASTTITFSVAPTTSKKGYLFAVDSFSEIYEIAAHDAGSTTATLVSPYTGTYNTIAPFKVWTDKLILPTDLRETVEVLHNFSQSPMQGVGLQEFRRRVSESPRTSQRPALYTTYDYEDPTPLDGETEADRYRVMKVWPSLFDTSTTIHIDYTKEPIPLELDGDEPLMPFEDRIVLVYGALARAWRRARNPDESATNYQLFQAKLGRMASKYDDSTDTPQVSISSNYLSRKRGRNSRLAGVGGFNAGGSYTAPTYLSGATIAGANLTGNLTANPGITVDGRDVSADGLALDSHLAGASAHAAENISVQPAGNLSSVNVQTALEELQTDVDTRATSTSLSAHTGATTGAHAASAISVTASGNLSSTDAQSALSELQGDIDTNTASIATNTSNIATNTSNIAANTSALALKAPLASPTFTGTVTTPVTASRALVTGSSSELAASATTATEIGYVSGVTSAIQTQLNAKAPLASPTFTGTITTPVTASRALTTNGSSQIAASATTATELGYLSGVTSSVQTQLSTNASNISTNSAKVANVVAPSGSNAFEVASTTGGFIGPRMTTTQRDALSSPAAGLEVYNTTTSKKQIYNGSSWQDVGSGSGSGINYIGNPDAETDTSGWATYADAAATSPVDGTGGTPSATWTRSTGSPLRGTAAFLLTKGATNRQGDGASYDFTIARADVAKVLTVSFEYYVNSGTYADDDVTVWIYDVTNATLIQPTGYKIKNASLQSKQTCTFQTASNSTAYRLIFHVSSTSASAYSLQFDTVSVGPQSTTIGAYVGDWTSYTPTGSWTANTTYTGQWRRVGDQMEFKIRLALAGAPTTAALTVNFLPSGLSVDTTKNNGTSAPKAIGWGITRSAGSDCEVICAYTSGTSLSVLALNSASTYLAASTSVTQAVPATYVSGDSVDLSGAIPITGWSSGMVLSDSSDTRVVACSVTRSATLAIGTSDTKVAFNSITKDTHGAFDAVTNNRYTVVVPGNYVFTGQINYGASGALLTSAVKLYKNGSAVKSAFLAVPSGATFGQSFAFMETDVKAGDYYELYASSSTAATAQTSSVLNINMLQGPSQIASSETVACRYYSSSSTPGTTSVSNKVTYATKDFDTHGAYSSGTFTAPTPGKYQVVASVYHTATTTAAGNAALTVIKKNGTSFSFTVGYFISSTAKPLSLLVSDVVQCVAGDTIEIFAGNDGTTPAISSNTQANYVSIVRVGN